MRKGFSELALNSVEWRTKQFYFICVFMSDIFFFAFVVLAEYCSGCPQSNISLDRLRTVYNLFYFSDDFPILFEVKTFCTTIILNNLHRLGMSSIF
jgi:hypothetical protein